MGFAGISPWSLLLILAIVVVVFGTKRVRTIGRDLGEALKGFREGMSEPSSTATNNQEES